KLLDHAFTHTVGGVGINPAAIADIGQNAAFTQAISAPADRADIAVVECVLVGSLGARGIGRLDPAIEVWIVDVLRHCIGRVAYNDADIEFLLAPAALRIVRQD